MARTTFPVSQSNGAVAQLGERLNGIQEVRGSIPLGSTKYLTNAVRSFMTQALRPRITWQVQPRSVTRSSPANQPDADFKPR